MSAAGFHIEDDVISAGECDRLIASLRGERRSRAGCRHLLTNPFVAAIASDPRLLGLAQRSLGDRATPFRATLFEKSGRANWLVVWHQDTALPLLSTNDSPEWGPWSKKEGLLYAHAPAWALERLVALRLHLDASTGENGSLRVIPGSHVAGVLSDDEVFSVAHRQEAVECLVAKGGVLSMRPLLIHSSSKAKEDAPRRVLHIEYADGLNLSDSIELVVA